MRKFPLIVAIAFLAGYSAAFAAEPSTAPGAEPPTLKLPAGARPTRYAITLTVVPGEANARGDIAIDVELDKPHSLLWLNADSLNVTRAAVELPETRLTLAFEGEQSRNSTRGIFAPRCSVLR